MLSSLNLSCIRGFLTSFYHGEGAGRKIREIGEDVDDVLLKAGKRAIGAGSMISGAGFIYHAMKQEDQTTALAEGIFGLALEVIGVYLFFG